MTKTGDRVGDSGTLAARLEQHDRDVFVGREVELATLERCLSPEDTVHVVYLHGPGGIGKSTLLRELGRRARAAGWETFLVEGRELAPTPDALDTLLAPALSSRRPLIVLDTYERMTALAGYLRRGLLPTLPATAVVVIGSRVAPDPGWFSDGWEAVTVELELGGLPPIQAATLVQAHGVSDARALAIVDWAGGSPLALALAADAAASDIAWNPDHDVERPEILRSLIRRLAETEVRDVRHSALMVASIARVTTPDLLSAVLPDIDAGEAYERLGALTCVEPLADGLTLHELVRRALRADFRRRDPEREHDLRRRIVDHLFSRAQAGDPLMAIEMSHLIENQTIKWGFGWEGSIDYRIDQVRPGDSEQITERLPEYKFAEWWALAHRFFAEAPARVAVARDRDEFVQGFMICMTPDSAPVFAFDDPLIGPWLVHARSEAERGPSVLWHSSIDFTRDHRGRVQAMLGVAGILRSGAPNPRFAYMPINTSYAPAVTFARVMQAEHIPELDYAFGPRTIECHRIDYGPGGLAAAQREVVYRELGLPSPRAGFAPTVDAEAVRTALRNFSLPHELAGSPLAFGESPAERVESVRGILRRAAEEAFGESENEKLLQRVLVRGYLEPSASHEQCAYELSLSRAAYFRRLRTATDRVVAHLIAQP